MAIFKCEMCGGNLLFNKGDTVAVCESCGTKQTVFYFDDSNKNSGNKFTIVQKPDYYVSIKELTENESFINDNRRLAFALGKDYKGNLVYGDLEEVQHLLITGASGFGKTNCLRSIIYSLMCKQNFFTPKFVIIDPKMIEFADFNGVPNLLVPVTSNPNKASGAISWVVTESLKRISRFAEVGARDINSYNKIVSELGEQEMSDIVVIIDDFYQIYSFAPKEIEESILRILQNGRTCGIHMIIASLQADKKFLPERIKNSIPSIISFALRTKAESKYVLDRSCAERLTTVGDMLYLPLGTSILKQVKCCFVNDSNVRELKELIAERASNNSIYDEEVNMQIERLIPRSEKPKSFNDDSDADEMLPKAIEVVVEAQEASTTIIQRKLKLGYARAARIVDELEARNIVGPYEGSKPRKVLITKQQWLEMNGLATEVEKDEAIVDELLQPSPQTTQQPKESSIIDKPKQIILNQNAESLKNIHVSRVKPRPKGEGKTYLYIDGTKADIDMDRMFALTMPLGTHTIQFKRGAAVSSSVIKLDFGPHTLYTIRFDPKILTIKVCVEREEL